MKINNTNSWFFQFFEPTDLVTSRKDNVQKAVLEIINVSDPS